MDLVMFEIWLAVAIILTLISFIFMGNIGIVTGFTAAAIWILTAMDVKSNPITTVVYFSPTESITQSLNLGISTDNIMILFILIGIYCMFVGFKSVFNYR